MLRVPALRLVFPVMLGLCAVASAADMPAPHAHARAHAQRHWAGPRYAPPRVVSGYGPGGYDHEDSGRYDGADLPGPGARRLAYGQPPSWLDGYGTRPVVYGAYGTTNVYGGSAQVMPFGLPPAGGLAVYSPGAYGPGPAIIEVPPGY